MSHEIRTPMNAIVGLTQLLEWQALAPKQLEMVRRIEGAGRWLHRAHGRQAESAARAARPPKEATGRTG